MSEILEAGLTDDVRKSTRRCLLLNLQSRVFVKVYAETARKFGADGGLARQRALSDPTGTLSQRGLRSFHNGVGTRHEPRKEDDTAIVSLSTLWRPGVKPKSLHEEERA